MRQTSLLVCTGRDNVSLDGIGHCYIKVFDLDKPGKKGEPGTCVRSTRLALLASSTSAISTCLAVHDNLTVAAVGFSNHCLLLLRGDITRDRGTKQKILLESLQGQQRNNIQNSSVSKTSPSISGLSFKSSSRVSWLYVATTDQILVFNLSAKDKESANQLDNIGCPTGLSVRVDTLSDTHFITGRNDAVYFYSLDGRGQCCAIEGEKSALAWFRNYLVVGTVNSSQQQSFRKQNSANNELDNDSKHTLTIFDVQNKYIAYTSPLKPIKAITTEWGTLFAITKDDNKVYQLTEKDIQTKLDLLFKKNFYDVAIKIAKSNQYDTYGLVDIFRQYGDHLYSKADYSGAIENYIKTIGQLEPSYVIRRFLDAHRIHDLTAYLRELHKTKNANEDHTILLLNCYTKLKDEERLDDFIFKKDKREALDFDVDIAIRVCRQAVYNSHALALAKAHGKHATYLQIQLDDLNNYEEALTYISSLPFEDAEKNVIQYGGTLLQNLPAKMVEFLKVLCTDYRSTSEPLISETELIHGGSNARIPRFSDPDNFLHHFFKKSDEAIAFLEHMIKVKPEESSQLVYNSLLEHYLQNYGALKGAYEEDMLDDDKMSSLKKMEKDLEKKIIGTLKNANAKYNSDHVLVMCQLHNFHPGTLYLYERKQLYGEILKHHIQHQNVSAAVATCRKFGEQNPGLWLQTLQFIANDCSYDNPSQQDQIAEILSVVEKNRLMSPLLVIRTLASSPNANLGLVRDFLKNAILVEDMQTKGDETMIDQYRVDTAEMKDKITRLKEDATTFQVSKCTACNHTLELPSVHFLCQHSYHQHCFQSYSESEMECPACHIKNKRILDIIKSQKQSQHQHDQFHERLGKAPGGIEDSFAVVADYFGRGLFKKKEDGGNYFLKSQPSSQQLVNKIDRGAVSNQPSNSIIEQMKNIGISENKYDMSNEQSGSLGTSLRASSHHSQYKQGPSNKGKCSKDVSERQIEPTKQADTNPFGNNFENSPEKLDPKPLNPFGEDLEEDYDESLNPFA